MKSREVRYPLRVQVVLQQPSLAAGLEPVDQGAQLSPGLGVEMRRVIGVRVEQQSAGIRPGVRHGGPFVVPSNQRARRGENQVHRQAHRPRSASHSSHFRHGVRTLAGVRISNAVRIGVAAASLVVAAGAAGCSDTVDGRAICIGCGPTEPGLPNPTPPTTSTPSGPTLDPSESGYVYIQTKSGLTRCQLNTASVGCEAPFENPPELNGEPANGVEVTADGSVRWLVGNPATSRPPRWITPPTTRWGGRSRPPTTEPGSPTTEPATACSSASRRSRSSRLARVDFRVFVEPQQGAGYEQQLTVAKAAESLGYSAFSVPITTSP